MTNSLYSINYHLKAHKRDNFIEFLKSLFLTPFILQSTSTSSNALDSYLEILKSTELLIKDHHLSPSTSSLSRLIPSIGLFFTPLALVKAFENVAVKRSLLNRRFVPPSFNDVRFLLNEAQVVEISKDLKLVTFDGDMTLYADGGDFERDSVLVSLIVDLLRFFITIN
jgi:IMP and pyridine-specific 5'-nucleotidase